MSNVNVMQFFILNNTVKILNNLQYYAVIKQLSIKVLKLRLVNNIALLVMY